MENNVTKLTRTLPNSLFLGSHQVMIFMLVLESGDVISFIFQLRDKIPTFINMELKIKYHDYEIHEKPS